jgi:DNA modification methylase
MIHTQEETYTIYNQSCLDLMDSLEENSIDCIVTDPPYEIGFMGKAWDNTGIAFNIDTWKKALRVLKPGGYLLAFNHSRTFHRMMVAIEDAGFELRDTIMYLYGSGFPKSHNISKAIDKSLGHSREDELEFANHIKKTREHNNITLKEFNNIFGYVAGCNWWESENHNNYRVPNQKDYQTLISKYGVSKKYQKIVDKWYPKGKKIGEKVRGNAGFSNEQVPRKWKEKIGETMDLTELVSLEAKKYDGYGTALKPAFEPIVMARKPFKSSVAENILKYGVGGINIDECRIEFVNEKDKGNPLRFQTNNGSGEHGIFNASKDVTSVVGEQGRFPANIIHDGSEEACSGFPDTKTGDVNPHIDNTKKSMFGNIYDKTTTNHIGDQGSASRYFYTAKASVKDRDEGLDSFVDGIITDGREKPIDNAYNRGESIRKNIHPTVKPTDLMQYLVRLVAPKGSTVLDIFMGSGSTGKAVMIENTERNAGYHFIGVDLEKEYCDIAKARIEWGINFKKLEDTHMLYEDDGTMNRVIQGKLDL